MFKNKRLLKRIAWTWCNTLKDDIAPSWEMSNLPQMNKNQNQANLCQRATKHILIYHYSQRGRRYGFSKLSL